MSEPTIAQKAPYAVEVKAGMTYWWCACGRSKLQPFCDGSHKDTGFNPVEYRCKQSGTVHLCGCKHTANAPLCDGTHNSL